jgi:lipoyl(octanoyl) transferase
MGIEAFRAPGRIGIWTLDGGQEAKIGAIGVRIRQWVTLHGFAVNLNPDLGHFTGSCPAASRIPGHQRCRLGNRR